MAHPNFSSVEFLATLIPVAAQHLHCPTTGACWPLFRFQSAQCCEAFSMEEASIAQAVRGSAQTSHVSHHLVALYLRPAHSCRLCNCLELSWRLKHSEGGSWCALAQASRVVLSQGRASTFSQSSWLSLASWISQPARQSRDGAVKCFGAASDAVYA